MASFLVLWDVDFTLVNASGVGRYLYQLAFAELYGKDLPERANEASMAGRTDRAIALDVLALAGVPDPRGQVSEFEAALARLAPGLAGLVAATAKPLPGAEPALAALAALGDRPEPVHSPDQTRSRALAQSPDETRRPGLAGGQASQHRVGPAGGRSDGTVRQSLLTGNVRPLAEVKLAPLGLTEHLDLDVGAYGNEHEARAELVHLARKRAALAYGHDFGGETTVIIGDTPNDVDAALVTGARAVAVATGFFTMEELVAAGAHVVLPDLTDTKAVLAAVLAN